VRGVDGDPTSVRYDPALLIRFARGAGDQRLANLIARRLKRGANVDNSRNGPIRSRLALHTLERLVRLLGLGGDSG
jgi:hypothetical protein